MYDVPKLHRRDLVNFGLWYFIYVKGLFIIKLKVILRKKEKKMQWQKNPLNFLWHSIILHLSVRMRTSLLLCAVPVWWAWKSERMLFPLTPAVQAVQAGVLGTTPVSSARNTSTSHCSVISPWWLRTKTSKRMNECMNEWINKALLNRKTKFKIARNKYEWIKILLDLRMKNHNLEIKVAAFSFQRHVPGFPVGREILNASSLPKVTALIHSGLPKNILSHLSGNGRLSCPLYRGLTSNIGYSNDFYGILMK